MIQGKNSKNNDNNKSDFTEKIVCWFNIGRYLMFVFINTFQLTSDKVDNIGNYQI